MHECIWHVTASVCTLSLLSCISEAKALENLIYEDTLLHSTSPV